MAGPQGRTLHARHGRKIPAAETLPRCPHLFTHLHVLVVERLQRPSIVGLASSGSSISSHDLDGESLANAFDTIYCAQIRFEIFHYA